MRRTTILRLPSPALVVMVGASGSGKSTFCRRHFRRSEIVSTDACRERLSGDAANQSVSAAAFQMAHRLAEKRLRLRRLTVFDATSIDARGRRPLLAMAARHHVPAVAVVLDLPLAVCLSHDRRRARRVGGAVIGRQRRRLLAGLGRLRAEGFTSTHRLRSASEVLCARVARAPFPACDHSEERGPFDIIGDVHGCALELTLLLRRLGYRRPSPRAPFRHPGGRRAVFVGDLMDRGPGIVEAARIVMRMVGAGAGLCVPGNHEMSFLDSLEDESVSPSPGTVKTLRQIEALPARERRMFLEEFRTFFLGLPPHLVLDRGRLAVAHAGITAGLMGRSSGAARRFAIFGQTTGDVDRFGLPVRVKWAAEYRGRALVVYGHTPVPEPEWIRNTVNIDTGCVYGGKLTALRYPEMTTVSIKAREDYYRPRRALPRGVGVRAETRALPGSGIISDRPTDPARRPRRWPVEPPRLTPGLPNSPPASLSHRTEPSTG